MEHEDLNRANPRINLLAETFSPGTEVVCFRSGERIIQGKVSQIDGRKAVVVYKYLGAEKQDTIPLEKLNLLNPGLHKRFKSQVGGSNN